MGPPKNALKETGQRIAAGGSNCWNLDHQIVSQTVAIGVYGRSGVTRVPVRYEELRVVERSAPIQDPLISQGFQKGDYCVDLIRGQQRSPKWLDECSIGRQDGRHIAAPAV